MFKKEDVEVIEEIVEVDHIGYAVKNMASAKALFYELGYVFGSESVDELRKVAVCVGQNVGRYKVELLAPLKGIGSPVDGYLQKVGSTPYHICYRVKNMDLAVSELQNRGFTLMGYPAPSIPLGGDVCFLYSGDIGIVELIYYKNEG